MGYLNDGYQLYKPVQDVSERLSQKLGRVPTLKEVEDEVIVNHPLKQWSKRRMRRTIVGLWKALDEQGMVPNGSQNGTMPIRSESSEERCQLLHDCLRHIYRQAVTVLGNQSKAQQVVILHWLRKGMKCKWCEILEQLTAPSEAFMAEWKVMGDDLGLVDIVPCDWKVVCQCFASGFSELSCRRLRIFHNRAWKKLGQLK